MTIPSIKNNHKLFELEDNLLLLGLVKFGRADIDSIRAFCLPTKTCTVIKTRISNANRNISNPVKSFMLQPFKPMNESERHVLYWVSSVFTKGNQDAWYIF